MLAAADPYETREQREWLARQFEGLTSEIRIVTPSQWAEEKRYLPPSVTSMPGYFRFEIAPYLREIVDCLGVESPIRELTIQKGVQLCLTTGVLENALGYYIEHVRSAPIMLVTANNELAKMRMESHITPMLQMSGLDHLIRSNDEISTKKTGKTSKKLEWFGGGCLVPLGSLNAANFRSLPMQILFRDEVDAWPDTVGKDGDPLKLTADRTSAYEASRKILDISTPLIAGQSKIEQRFKRGDQRYYFIRCLKCNFAQVLTWRHEDRETGVVSGMHWELQNGRLIPDSVRYLCLECQHPHSNDDKTRLLAPEHGAEWRATAEPMDQYHRSYHISALYSPVGMQTWAACVHKYLEAWDSEANRARDTGALQVFFNGVLGEPYQVTGEKIRFESVSAHRRTYHYGQIPNRFALEHCGGPVLMLTCAVDVHKDQLVVAVIGWCRDRRAILIDYWRFMGTAENLQDMSTWGQLRHLIEYTEYKADDGKIYRVQLTLIDSGYYTDQVYQFAAEYASGVFPLKGREIQARNVTAREFSEFKTPNGVIAYGVSVDFYKDRWAAALRRGWDGLGVQPQGHFNAPLDSTDKQLTELTVERKTEKVDKETGKHLGVVWRRVTGVPNELWDLLIYNTVALDLLAWNWCLTQRMEATSLPVFFEACERDKLFFEA